MGLNDGRPHVVALRYLKEEDTWAMIVNGGVDSQRKMKNAPDAENSVFKLTQEVVVFEPFEPHVMHHIKYSTNRDEFE